MTTAQLLERPLPKPGRDLAGYASARILEALLEGVLALEFLGKGYTRNAAGKAFQAWKAMISALLALEKEKLLTKLGRREERKWLEKTAIPRTPTTRLLPLASLLEDLGYSHLTAYTHLALNLHDYQYHGPDPDMELSKYRSRHEAAQDIQKLLRELEKTIENLKPKLEEKRLWSHQHTQALNQLREKLSAAMHQQAS